MRPIRDERAVLERFLSWLKLVFASIWSRTFILEPFFQITAETAVAPIPHFESFVECAYNPVNSCNHTGGLVWGRSAGSCSIHNLIFVLKLKRKNPITLYSYDLIPTPLVCSVSYTLCI